ncbi:MAG: PadR family transcriptional regulator [Candidatus Pacebacteria bacterium]|nr:PadR family transcriptional regulator [Candidatus Paceibacterota bacterium]MDD2757090.1 PadR family transcriptional regulator [Candidatus Paceibacterota bacterium]MDD3283710.1 PadR family transcriptional regulator [Candidatus Paceibacterota bacterium]MDD3969815.1 PadR family transcriptional regulator [Candidatus Paceibacterota bacterium]
MTPYERFIKTNTKENLWIYILIILKRGPHYAWDMYSVIEKEFGFKPGSITPYRVLYRLEEQNYVESEKINRKRIYKITALGEKELEKAKDFYLQIAKQING